MSSLPSHRVFEWLELQDLIDEALFEVFADYDMSESIQTRAVAVHHDGFHRVMSLRDADGAVSACKRPWRMRSPRSTPSPDESAMRSFT